ncbi:MAG: VPLPA-CTERM sorting domain-containing protein [Gammaproteobacteria bacterium]|nr:VPLPA-CTERM sorting domain-containing protein [Gammaproteobacteria bacterium]
MRRLRKQPRNYLKKLLRSHDMMKMKTLVAAIAIAAAGTANAAIDMANTGSSSLVLSVWDNVAQESYIRDLGLNLADITPAMITPDAGLTLNFAADPLFASLFGNNTASDIYWNITAADSTGSGSITGRQIIGTGALGALASSFSVTNTGVANSANYWNTFFANANTQPNVPGVDTNNCTTNTSCYSLDAGDLQYAGDTSWGTFWGQNLTGWNNAGTLGQSLGFYSFTPSSTSGFVQSTKVRYENAYGLGTWMLAANGSVTYSIASAPVSTVPVPAAAWLFGTGLAGLASVARRRVVS